MAPKPRLNVLTRLWVATQHLVTDDERLVLHERGAVCAPQVEGQVIESGVPFEWRGPGELPLCKECELTVRPAEVTVRIITEPAGANVVAKGY